MDRLRRRLGGRPLLHRLRAAARRRDDRAVRGQAGRHPGRRRVLAGGRASTASRRCSPRRPRSARSRRRTRTAALLAELRPVVAADPVPGRRAARPRHLRSGRASGSASRSSTTGGRPRPAGRSPRTCAASSRCRSSRARRRCRCRASTSRSSTSAATPCRAGHRGRDLHRGCRCRPGTLPTLWGDDERFVASYLSAFDGLLPHRRRRLRRRGRLPVRDGPHRRRHQRGRAPAVHRVDGGGARRATRPSRSAR